MKLILSLAVGFIVGLIVTELLASSIFFSLFVGIPAGIISACITFSILHFMDMDKIKKDKEKMQKFKGNNKQLKNMMGAGLIIGSGIGAGFGGRIWQYCPWSCNWSRCRNTIRKYCEEED